MAARRETPSLQPEVFRFTEALGRDMDGQRKKEHAMEKLRKPWSAAELTESQLQQKQDDAAARKLWEEVLEEFREKKKTSLCPTILQPRLGENETTPKNKDQPFFPFLKLPGEIRNKIYDFVLASDSKERDERKRPLNTKSRSIFSNDHSLVSHTGFASRILAIYEWCTETPLPLDPKSRTPEQKRYEEARQKLLENVVEERLREAKNEGRLTDDVHKAFKRYHSEHDMYTQRCWHEEHTQKPRWIAKVNARGNLCDDLPLFALTNRQIFNEMFYLFYSIPGEVFWVKFSIRDLDFFPFLRFWQMLERGPWPLYLKLHMIHLDFVAGGKDDDNDNDTDGDLHPKFANVKRLIEMHWLDGFPLWSCFTGLYGNRACGPFGDWMYAVRQIVALYQADNTTWRAFSVTLMHHFEVTDDGKPALVDWETQPDAEIVEAVIDVLGQAIEYHLGYEGWFPCPNQIGTNWEKWEKKRHEVFRFTGGGGKAASNPERAVVFGVQVYCCEVDQALKKLLGDEYEAWEWLPEEESIPQGVVL